MTDARFTQITSEMTALIQEKTPYDTNNLKLVATRSESLGANQFRISVDTKIAPYFKYVNFYKNHRYRKSDGSVVDGKPNPNYRYWDNAIRAAAESMARSCNGRVEIV